MSDPKPAAGSEEGAAPASNLGLAGQHGEVLYQVAAVAAALPGYA